MGILRDQILGGAKIESLEDAIKIAETKFEDVSQKMRNAIENEEFPGQKIIVKEGKKIVHKTSEISNDIFQQHKDKLPKEVKPLTDTVGLILESIIDLTKEDDAQVVDSTAEKADKVEKTEKTEKGEAKPEKKARKAKTTRGVGRPRKKSAETNAPADSSEAPQKRRGRPRKTF